MRTRVVWAQRCALSLVAVLTVAFATSGGAALQSATTYNMQLSLAEQSQDDQGRTLLTMMSAGDLQGVLTLAVTTAADGSITGGEWALTVSYTEPNDPNAQPDPTSSDPDSGRG